MSVKHIGDLKKTECYGCSACVYSCPFGAITMERDSEGFRYPVVDEEKCTGCGKCRKICPSICPKDMSNAPEPESYAVWADDKLRMDSTSGGAFTLIARNILAQGGVVCGVVMDEKFHIFHTIATNEKEIEPMRRSKYVESDLGDMFPRIKELLEKGTKVLFTGTPCQVAGLKAYLGNKREGLIAVDLMCHGGTSPKVFERYLDETFGRENVKRFYFRTKYYGYNGTTCAVVLKDGQTYMGSGELDPFVKGSYRSLFLRKSCEDCKFASMPRQGDITIGDCWGIAKYKAELSDGRGTSLILVNNEKGRKIVEEISANTQVFEKVPLEAVTWKNRFKEHMQAHSQRDRFFEMLNYTSMHKAVKYCMENRYDVGVLGVWFGCNYGSIATYYGLMKQLQGLGLSVLMIDKPGFVGRDREVAEENHSRVFANTHFHVSKRYKLNELRILNHICDSFVIGSDQVWNHGIARNFGRSFLMDFVRDEKKKVAVAASFGHDRDFRSNRERIIASEYFKRFDAISVREESAVGIMKRVFGVDATRVLDPVFSTDRQVYDDIAAESTRNETEPYMLTYILDPTPEKKEVIRHLSEKLGLRTIHILDGTPWNYESNKEKLGMDTILENVTFQDCVYYFKNSSYVLTDSCHGMSFAIIYHKPFAGIGNAHRGMTRFASLTKLFHVEDRFVTNPLDIIKNDHFLEPMDYTQVEEIMEKEKAFFQDWLKNAMFSEKTVKTYQAYPAKIETTEAADIHVKINEPIQVKQTFLRRVYYHLPVKVQNKVKPIVKNYFKKKAQQ